MLRRKRVLAANDFSKNWTDNLLILWEEDDAPVPDKEKVDSAFFRITQHRNLKDYIYKMDLGDTVYYVYREGWVRIMSYDGGAVGVLVNME